MLTRVDLEKLLRRAFNAGPIQRIPKNTDEAKGLLALSLVDLDVDGIYDEVEIDAHLNAWLQGIASGHADHVTWRRALYDYGFLRRATDGAIYRIRVEAIAAALQTEAYDLNPREIRAEVDEQRIARQQKYAGS